MVAPRRPAAVPDPGLRLTGLRTGPIAGPRGACGRPVHGSDKSTSSPRRGSHVRGVLRGLQAADSPVDLCSAGMTPSIDPTAHPAKSDVLIREEIASWKDPPIGIDGVQVAARGRIDVEAGNPGGSQASRRVRHLLAGLDTTRRRDDVGLTLRLPAAHGRQRRGRNCGVATPTHPAHRTHSLPPGR
jgi:hypothetical protein